jgi:tetratricopeptide (TPR) repeat protein
MRRLAAAVSVFAVTALLVEARGSTSTIGWRAALQPRQASSAQSDAPPWLARLSSYLQSVREHRPGELDMAARLTGFTGEAELGDLRTDLFALVAAGRRELSRSARPAPVVYRGTEIPIADLLQTLGLPKEEAAQGNANRILKRAAVLHADVAMLVIPLLPGRIGCSAASSMLVRDGNRIGMGCIDIHWIHSRLLLDGVRPDPAKDEDVRRWYVASATYFLEFGNYANARPHLEKARLLFRSDPETLFVRGYYAEAFASPHIQSVAVEAGADRPSAKSCLEEAEDLYHRAINANPQFVEARVRRGSVLSLLGRHGDAAEELRAAVAGAQGPWLRYYAELFLGQAEQSVGDAGAARRHFREAAALFPRAQSPLLALALLERELGDRARAQDAMKQLLDLPAAREEADDPWSNYYRWQNVDFKTRFAALHARLAEEETR